MSEVNHDDAAPIGNPTDPGDIVETVQEMRLNWLIGKNVPDKETLKLAKDITDTSLKQQQLISNDKNSSADRDLIMALAENSKHSRENPFEVVVPAEGSPALRTPSRPSGEIISDIEITEENTSTEFGSPSYDELFKSTD